MCVCRVICHWSLSRYALISVYFYEKFKNIHVDYDLLVSLPLTVYIFQVSYTDVAQFGQIASHGSSLDGQFASANIALLGHQLF